jgi:hypothetical protein
MLYKIYAVNASRREIKEFISTLDCIIQESHTTIIILPIGQGGMFHDRGRLFILRCSGPVSSLHFRILEYVTYVFTTCARNLANFFVPISR